MWREVLWNFVASAVVSAICLALFRSGFKAFRNTQMRGDRIVGGLVSSLVGALVLAGFLIFAFVNSENGTGPTHLKRMVASSIASPRRAELSERPSGGVEDEASAEEAVREAKQEIWRDSELTAKIEIRPDSSAIVRGTLEAVPIVYKKPVSLSLGRSVEFSAILASADLKKAIDELKAVKGTITQRTIALSPKVKVTLSGNPDDVAIVADGDETRWLSKTDNKKWVWWVKALHPGSIELSLVVTNYVKIDGEDHDQEHEAYSDTFQVEVDVVDGAIYWVTRYSPVIAATMPPVGVVLYLGLAGIARRVVPRLKRTGAGESRKTVKTAKSKAHKK